MWEICQNSPPRRVPGARGGDRGGRPWRLPPSKWFHVETCGNWMLYRDVRHHMTSRCVLALSCATWLAAADTPQALMDSGHHKRLRAMAEPLYREHPNDPEALWMMSFVKLSWGDHKAALDLAEKAVAADPKNPRYRLGLAQALGEEAQEASILRQPGLARRFKKELETTLTIDPKNVAAMKFLILYDFEAPG